MGDTRTTQTTVGRPDGFLARHWQKLLAAAIWLTLAGSFLGYSLVTGSTPTEWRRLALRSSPDLQQAL